jgi:hypothetical protein
LGGEIIRISQAIGSPKRKNRTAINGKFNDISNVDENK